MKKRTKTKIKKAISKTVKSFGKGIWRAITWLARGFWSIIVWCAGKIYHFGKKGAESTHNKIKETHERKKIEKEQPKTEAQVQDFEEVESLKGSAKKFEEWLYSKSSLIGIILGARGTGKSAIGMFLLENFKARSQKKIYALGFKQSAVPKWIRVIKSIEQIENNAVLLIDEGGIEFSSRSSMSDANKLLSEILLIARHKDLSVIFISQNSANLEVNAIRQTDFLLLKPSSLLQKDFERKKIKTIYEDVHEEYENLKHIVGITYIYSDKFRGFATNTLPSFWSDKVSKGYAQK